MALFGSLRSRLRKRVLISLAGDPAWGIVAGKAWICPYCATVGVEDMPEGEEARADAVLDHIVDKPCADAKEGEGTPRPLIELKREAGLRDLRRRVKKELVRSPAWQLLDLRRRWFCPYCGEATEVEIPNDKTMTEDVLRALVGHVEGCHAYDKGRGELKPIEELKATVKNMNRGRKLAEDVRRKVEQDPLFRQKDARGRWVCPFCLLSQQHIDLSTTVAMFENAPALIAKHLLQACERWKEGVQPKLLQTGSASPSASRPATGANAAPPPPAAPPAPAPPATAANAAAFPERADRASSADAMTTADERSSSRMAKRTGQRRQKAMTDVWGRDALNVPASAPDGNGDTREGSATVPGKTLRQIENSGEFTLIDDPEVRKVTSSNRPSRRSSSSSPATSSSRTPTSDGSASAPDERSESRSETRSVDWRREIERELAQVRLQVPEWQEGSSLGLEDTAQADVRDAAQAAAGLPGFELRLLLRPASPPRGDFVEVLKLEQGKLGILLGGVAGEDAESALVAAMARNLIRLNARREPDPAAVLRKVNQEIFQDLDARTFVSASYAILDGPRRTLTVARAGLPAPLVVNRARQPSFGSVDCEGMVMGIDRGPIFDTTVQSRVFDLQPGDLIVFVSAGILEVRSASREELGLEKLQGAVRKYGFHEAEYLVYKMGQLLDDWTRGSDPLADACLAALKLAEK